MNIGVNKVAERLLRAYDTNRDGVIDARTEKYRVVEHDNEDHLGGNVISRMRDHFGHTYKRAETYTHTSLFTKADTNNDAKVTQEELRNLASSFDADKNGALESRGFWGWLTRKPKNEREQFEEAIGNETRVSNNMPFLDKNSTTWQVPQG